MLLVSALVAVPLPWDKAQCAQPAAKAKKRVQAAKPAPVVQAKPKLTAEELLTPYSTQHPTPGVINNASRLFFEPAPTGRPFSTPETDPGFRLRLGREHVRNPLTGEGVPPKPDAAKAAENLKNRDVKGALDKVGGKAEVQVDILKF